MDEMDQTTISFVEGQSEFVERGTWEGFCEQFGNRVSNSSRIAYLYGIRHVKIVASILGVMHVALFLI